MLLVRCKIIPEVLKINALAAAHERFRRRSVKPEMPDAGVVVCRFPSGDAGEKSVHQDELFGFRGKLCSVRVSNHETDIVADDSGFLDTDRTNQQMYADRGALHVQTVFRNR